jgi:ubiquinone/menaquinone biosynthesis C-methylase UbiE
LFVRSARLPLEKRARRQKQLFKLFYGLVNRAMDRDELAFMNFGYASTSAAYAALDLSQEREEERYAIQLYDRVAGAVALGGRDVLEVGCGRGGGAAFVFEHHGAASMTGLDLSERAIASARRRYRRSDLEFVAGDAEALPFPSSSFDAVVNVESSHCYPRIGVFLKEVERVLRPGGVFLFADLRRTRIDGPDGERSDEVARLREELIAAGLAIIEEEDITENVLTALTLDSPRRRALVERKVPRPLRSRLLDFSGVEGSATFNSFAGRELTYVRLVLRRARDAAAPVAA